MPTTPHTASTPSSLEAEVASLLNDLLAGQGELMAVLNRKRNLLGAMDREGLAAIADDEQRMLGVLQDCLTRRQALLARAAGGAPLHQHPGTDQCLAPSPQGASGPASRDGRLAGEITANPKPH